MPIPEEPILFAKFNSAICGLTMISSCAYITKLDWEVELGVVIGKDGKYIDEATPSITWLVIAL